MVRALRILWRSILFGIVLIGSLADWLIRTGLHRGGLGQRQRAAWLQRWARRFFAVFNARLEVAGDPPAGGLCVANHLSYVDILAFGSVTPAVFVSKDDVRDWPVFGALARIGGTLFVERERRSNVADVGAQMVNVLAGGLPLMLFPEGTSSGGDAVLPFKSSLFEPAARRGLKVTPACVAYSRLDGSRADEVPYWADMTLVPHILNLFGCEGFVAHVTYGEPLPVMNDRKELCRSAHRVVSEQLAVFNERFQTASSVPAS